MSQATTYELKRFTKSTDKDFINALIIYSNNIPHKIKTDTREISYWLDRYDEKFKGTGDQLLLFGFFRNKKIIGFSEITYQYSCNSCKFIFIDYMAIDEEYRRNNVFYEFIEHIKEFLRQNGYFIDFAITEVSNLNNKKEPEPESQALIRLLKQSGFKVIRFEFLSPMLGLENYESEIPGTLMVYTFSSEGVDHLKRETYQDIIYSILYNHYLRWYSYDKNMVQDYKVKIDNYYNRYCDKLQRVRVVLVNGHKNNYEEKDVNLDYLKTNNTSQYLQIISITISIFGVILFCFSKEYYFLFPSIIPLVLLLIISLLGLKIRSRSR